MTDGTAPEKMSLSAAEIADLYIQFTRILHADPKYAPYRWQIRLATVVAQTGIWPEQISAPTGAGKTAAVDAHLFAQALAGRRLGANAPRRLALIVNRRALVDSQYHYAETLLDNLETAATDRDADAVTWREALRARSGIPLPPTRAGDSARPPLDDDRPDNGVQLVNLRGGQEDEDPLLRQWRTYPELVSILCFTPEMFGSRLLFRGYGVSRSARPIEAGLLAYDTVAVIDEAHLARQLAHTARQVPVIEMCAVERIPAPVLQTVLSTATPATEPTSGGASAQGERRVISVTADDLADPRLRVRLTTPKPVSVLELSGSLGDRSAVGEFVAAAQRLHTDRGGTVGVVVNTVNAALDIAEKLAHISGDKSVVTIVGRMRGADRRALEDEHPNLFTSAGDPDIAYAIGTQTIEVGLDIGFSGMITELAPASALAQRAGRVNRFGLYPEGPIIVAVPPRENRDRGPRQSRRTPVYTGDDLDDALQWLSGFVDTEQGLSPWAIHENPPAPASQRRLLLETLRPWDVETLTATSEDLAADHQIGNVGPTTLDLWLRDDLDEETQASIAIRRDLPASDGLAVDYLETVPVLGEETAPTPVKALYGLSSWLADPRRQEATYDDEATPPGNADAEEVTGHSARAQADTRAFLLRADQRPQLITADTHFHTGDTVVVSDTAHLFQRKVLSRTGADALDDVFDTVLAHRNSVVRQRGSADSTHGALPKDWCVRIRIPAWNPRIPSHTVDGVPREEYEELARELLAAQRVNQEQEEDETEGETPDSLDAFRSWLASHPLKEEDRDTEEKLSLYTADSVTGTRLRELRWLIESGVDASDVVPDGATVDYLGTDDTDDEFIIIYSTLSTRESDEFIQVSTPTSTPVLLEAHHHNVGTMAEQLAEHLEMHAYARLLAQAGLLHDEGKKDPRFQELLRLGDRLLKRVDEPLAKSRFHSRSAERTFRAANHLRGWRHEQLSAAAAWSMLRQEPMQSRELITRLVGTTHGHGLPTFDRQAVPRAVEGNALGTPNRQDALIPRPEEASPSVVAAAKALFDLGRWEELVARTAHRHGYWGIAYLEAVLRAADIQTSRRGS